MKDYYHIVSCELSPYAWAARQYTAALGEPLEGVALRTLVGRVSNAVAFGHPTLQGMPIALFHSLGKRVRRILGLTPWRDAEVVAGQVLEPWGQRLLDTIPQSAAGS